MSSSVSSSSTASQLSNFLCKIHWHRGKFILQKFKPATSVSTSSSLPEPSQLEPTCDLSRQRTGGRCRAWLLAFSPLRAGYARRWHRGSRSGRRGSPTAASLVSLSSFRGSSGKSPLLSSSICHVSPLIQFPPTSPPPCLKSISSYSSVALFLCFCSLKLKTMDGIGTVVEVTVLWLC